MVIEIRNKTYYMVIGIRNETYHAYNGSVAVACEGSTVIAHEETQHEY